MAGTPMRRFKRLSRFLAVVVRSGKVIEAESATLTPDVFPSAPDSFPDRCSWALKRIPRGRVVNSTEFLLAIGAGPAYARALPRWLKATQAEDTPIHRLLDAHFEPASWAPDAIDRLESEDLSGTSALKAASYPLSEMIWFAETDEN